MLAGVHMRILTGVILLLAAMAARAELTCEQYGVIANETVRLRDQGASLQRVLANAERGEMKRLTPREMALVKEVIRLSFEGTLSPSEVIEACQDGGTLVPSR